MHFQLQLWSTFFGGKVTTHCESKPLGEPACPCEGWSIEAQAATIADTATKPTTLNFFMGISWVG
jgi:hypothetical protein